MTVDERTTFSDTDVLGAMGLASKSHPLACALERLFMGDNGATPDVVGILSDMAWRKARALGVRLDRPQSIDLARACLAWHRDGVCKPCGGHGQMVIEGTTTIGGALCKPCKGAGRIPFDRKFSESTRELARWLVAEMGREQANAGPEAMKRLAPRLDF